MYELNVSDEVVDQVVTEYLEPLTESGIIDEVMKDFVAELRPYARAAARHALANRRHALAVAGDFVMLSNLRAFLDVLARRLDILGTHQDHIRISRDLLRSAREIRGWIEAIDSRPSAASSEVAVPAAHEKLLARGDVP